MSSSTRFYSWTLTVLTSTPSPARKALGHINIFSWILLSETLVRLTLLGDVFHYCGKSKRIGFSWWTELSGGLLEDQQWTNTNLCKYLIKIPSLTKFTILDCKWCTILGPLDICLSNCDSDIGTVLGLIIFITFPNTIYFFSS